MKKTKTFFSIVMLTLMFSGQADHLIFTKVVTQPNSAEMIEITNPTNNDVELADYYITDATSTGNYYYNLPTGVDFWSESGRDFIAKFPEMTIGSGETLSISISSAEIFTNHFGYEPDLSLTEDLLNIDSFDTIGEVADLKDSRECLVLFKWEIGQALVQDVDYFLWGTTTYGVAKTKEDGYEFNDTPLAEQLPIRYYIYSDIVDSMYVRTSFDEVGETQEKGNGITGHDEMSEDFSSGWEIVPQYEVIYGCTDEDAPNYNPDATVDDGSCLVPFDELHSFQQVLSGAYDGSNVAVMGIIMSYVDITGAGGPHKLTLEDEEGNQLFLVWWPSDWDIGTTDLLYLLDAPFGQNLVQASGLVSEYNGDKQIAISSENNLNPVQINISLDSIELEVAPYPFIPSIGERIQYTFSVPENHRTVIRIFDLSGRFITSLLDGIPVFFQDDKKTEYWDGRTHLGELVNPGTYIIHLEATEFATGKSTYAIAPIVVGVSSK
jgi:hypothetical protein